MASPIYRFGAFRLDPAGRKLWRDDEEIALAPKAFLCLIYLIEHRDRVVEHSELIQAVWGDIYLSDKSLVQKILMARRALNDTSEAQLYIETVRGFGYRWVAPVEVEPAEPSTETMRAATRDLATPIERAQTAANARAIDRPVGPWLTSTLVVIGILVSGALVYLREMTPPHQTQEPPAARTEGEIALLLPVEVDADSDHAWVRLGIMDLLAEHLRTAGQAMVPSDTVVSLLRGMDAELGADELHRLTAATGAHLVLSAQARTSGTRWTVSLHSLLGAQPPLTSVGEAQDVLAAARTAADQMSEALGLVPVSAPDPEPDLARLLQQIEAARLAQQMDAAIALIDAARPRLRRHPRIRFERARMDYYSHRLDAAQAEFASLLEEVPAEQDGVLRARLLIALGVIHSKRYELETAARRLEEAIRRLAGQETSATLGLALESLGNVAQRRGDLDGARRLMAQARRIYEGIGAVQHLASVDLNVGLIEARREQYAEALRHFESAGTRYAAVRNLGNELLARAYMMQVYVSLLDPQAALKIEPRVSELVAQTANPELAARANLSRLYVLTDAGRSAKARALVEEVLTATSGNDDLHRYRMEALLWAADDALQKGDTTLAAQTATEVVERLAAGQIGSFSAVRGHAWWILVRARLAEGELAIAARDAAALADWVKDVDDLSAAIFAALAQAELAAAEGRYEAAEAAFERALARADHVPWHLLPVARSYVRWLLDEGPDGRSDPVQALTIADRLAAYADQHYEAALLQLRVYRVLGPPSAWRAALDRAASLAGERQIPPELFSPPDSGDETAGAHRQPRL